MSRVCSISASDRAGAVGWSMPPSNIPAPFVSSVGPLEETASIRDETMKTPTLLNYAQDQWHAASGGLAEVQSAVTGDTIAVTGSQGLDFKAMLDHARRVGGPALRRMTFHERAWMLKDLANAVMARK